MRRPFVLEISFIAHSTGTRPALARRPPQGPPFAATSESIVLRMQTPVNQGESRVGTSKFKGWRLLTIETQSQRGGRTEGASRPPDRASNSPDGCARLCSASQVGTPRPAQLPRHATAAQTDGQSLGPAGRHIRRPSRSPDRASESPVSTGKFTGKVDVGSFVTTSST